MSRQNEFQQKMAQLNAKAQASGKKMSTYDPHAPLSSIGASSTRKLVALVFSMVLVLAIRALVFHNPTLLESLALQGLPVGLIGGTVLPILAVIILPRFLGLAGKGLNFWVFLGFMLMFFGENMFLIQNLPTQWAMIYSQDYVDFVVETGGSLATWLNSGEAGIPVGDTRGLMEIGRDLMSSVSGGNEAVPGGAEEVTGGAD